MSVATAGDTGRRPCARTTSPRGRSAFGPSCAVQPEGDTQQITIDSAALAELPLRFRLSPLVIGAASLADANISRHLFQPSLPTLESLEIAFWFHDGVSLDFNRLLACGAPNLQHLIISGYSPASIYENLIPLLASLHHLTLNLAAHTLPYAAQWVPSSVA